MRRILTIILFALLLISVAIGPYLYKRYQQHKAFNIPAATPPSSTELGKTIRKKLPKKAAKVGKDPILGINTADVREDTSSVPFLNLFKSAIPFDETIPWGSSKEVEYDKNGWPTNLHGGKAGTKFLNRLPEGTIEDGFFTVLYDGEGEIFYGNDARLVVHRPGKDVIEIKAGKDHILNASLFIKKTTPDNYIRNIRILPEGGICEGVAHIRVKSASECGKKKYLAFEENDDKILFNPDYLAFMKDFQVIRFMNMSGMTRNPVEHWEQRNTLGKATWGGKYGSRGAPVEIMVALANQVKADPWFSMPYKASDDYIRKFAEYVKAHLDPGLRAYIEYSNEVWNPIFIHHDYAIEKGMQAGLDDNKSLAGYKWYSRRSVQTFKIWEEVFGGTTQLVRTLGSWASNQNMSSQILAFEDAYKHTDAIAIGPYVSAHPKELRKANNVDEVFKLMMDKNSKWGMQSIIRYINNQVKVAKSYGVDLVAYEGGQHLVDWDTRTKDQDPNPLLYAANRDPRMGIIYDELLREWRRAGGKLFVAFSAPRIYSWYGSWGVKEYIRQPRSEAPKYDALLRYLDETLHPENINQGAQKTLENKQDKPIGIRYAKLPYQIWDMSKNQLIKPASKNTSISDISTNWQANWDSGNLYFSFSVRDDSLVKGDELILTLDATDTQKNEKNKTKQEPTSDKNPETSDKDDNNEQTPVAKTFVFSPFDNNSSQTHLTKTALGYIINVAIPWSEIYQGKGTPKTGDKIGINIKVSDVDDDERGSQTLYLSKQNEALPYLELNY